MRINTNLAALNTWKSLSANQTNLQKSLERLSSGSRINRAADDAAGLAVSEKMRAQIRGINMAVRNAQDGVSLVQTAEGSASQIQNMLQRMRELAVQASSETLGDSDRSQLSLEFNQLRSEIGRTSDTANFNGISLLKGGAAGYSTAVSNSAIAAIDGGSAPSAASSLVVNVSQKAEVATLTSSGATYKTESGADPGTYRIAVTIGTDPAVNVDVAVGVDSTISAADVASAINGATAGITASVTADGHLQIVSDATGSNQSVSVAEYYDTTLAAGTTASNVFFTAGDAKSASGKAMLYSVDNGTTVSNLSSETMQNVVLNGTGPTVDFSGALGRVEINTVDTATTTAITIQVGASGATGNSLALNIDALNTDTLGNLSALNISTKSAIDSTTPLSVLDSAIATVSSARAKLGAQQNRLENAIGTLQTQAENLTAADSRVRDVDMAAEMAQFTKFQVLGQASTAMLAQANQLSQSILTLLR